MIRSVSSSSLPWQSLTTFTATTTLHDKVWRVVNNLGLVAAGISLYAIASRRIRQLHPAFSYAGYLILALTLRKIIAIGIGYLVYPATRFPKRTLADAETIASENLRKEGFTIQKLTLHKSGVSYDAALIYHSSTASNGKWSLHALGNGMTMEGSMEKISTKNKLHGANTLLINGPSVGRSGGFPTRYQEGAGFEAGLQLLEQAVEATRILLHGFSLGGGMLAEAALAHNFNTDNVKYLAIFDRTFSRLSALIAALLGSFATPLCSLLDVELDTVFGAKNLKQLGIQQIIIQHKDQSNPTDGVIPDSVSLASHLEEDQTRSFFKSHEIFHNDPLPEGLEADLDGSIRDFFTDS
jgi:hypothetical protein